MTLLIYKNNATTTLDSGISATALTVVLATGTGSKFPQPIDGQSAFFMTFMDAATKLVNEIVLVTDRSGDALTIVRGQQNTAAVSWAAGDIAAQLWTLGDAAQMIQPDVLQGNQYNSATAGGTVNSITAAVPSGLTAIPDMFQLTVEALGANTGNTTLTLTLGSTVQTAYPILKYGGSQLNAGDIPEAGYPISLTFSITLDAFIMNNPGTGTAGSIAGGAAWEVLYQSAPGTTAKLAAPTVAGQVLAWTGSALAWLAAAVTSFNGRAGVVMPQAGDYTPAQVGAIAASLFAGSNVQFNNPLYFILPFSDGSGKRIIVQAGSQSVIPNNPTPITYPHTFSVCVAFLAVGDSAAAALRVVNSSPSFGTVTVNASNINWIAVGWG